MSIQVEADPDGVTFQVSVDGRTRTEHTVTVDRAYADKLTGGRISTSELVRKSFEFLLEREPNTSILGEFNLKVISRYFPEYETEIRQ